MNQESCRYPGLPFG